MGLKKNSPGCSCCVSCPVCVPPGGAPSSFEVVIANITNGSCTDCDDLNGTFIADYQGTNGATCYWRYTFPSTTCEVQTLYVTIKASQIDVILMNIPDFMAGNPSKDVEWRNSGLSDIDCGSLSSESISYLGNFNIGCTTSSGTASISAQ